MSSRLYNFFCGDGSHCIDIKLLLSSGVIKIPLENSLIIHERKIIQLCEFFRGEGKTCIEFSSSILSLQKEMTELTIQEKFKIQEKENLKKKQERNNVKLCCFFLGEGKDCLESIVSLHKEIFEFIDQEKNIILSEKNNLKSQCRKNDIVQESNNNAKLCCFFLGEGKECVEFPSSIVSLHKETSEIIDQEKYIILEKNNLTSQRRKNDIVNDDDDDDIILTQTHKMDELMEHMERISRKRKRNTITSFGNVYKNSNINTSITIVDNINNSTTNTTIITTTTTTTTTRPDSVIIKPCINTVLRQDPDSDDDDDDLPVSQHLSISTSMMMPLFSTREPTDEEFFEGYLVKKDGYYANDIIKERFRRNEQTGPHLTKRDLEDECRRKCDLHTRQWEDDHLRTPWPNTLERPCANGTSCRGFIQFRTILIECLTQQEYQTITTTGRIPPHAGFCIRCIRYRNGDFYESSRADLKPSPFSGFVSPFYNKPGEKGEYLLDNCLLSTGLTYSGFPLPVVAEIPNYYTLKEVVLSDVSKVFYNCQTYYRKPEELSVACFQKGPTCL